MSVENVVIQTQPVGGYYNVGNTVTLYCIAENAGGGLLKYQWFENGEVIVGENLSTYSQIVDQDSYQKNIQCAVHTDDGGEVGYGKFSYKAIIREREDGKAALIHKDVIHTTYTDSEPVSFICSASGKDMTYQWYKDGAPLGGETGTCYSREDVQLDIAAPLLADEGSYHCVFSNTGGDVSSSVVILRAEDGVRQFSVGDMTLGYAKVGDNVEPVQIRVFFGDFFGSLLTGGWPGVGSDNISMFAVNTAIKEVVLKSDGGTQWGVATGLTVDYDGVTVDLVWDVVELHYSAVDAPFVDYLAGTRDDQVIEVSITVT